MPEPPRPRGPFVDVAWAEDGMEIWIRWSRETNSLLRCTVAVAAGNHVRVVNENRNVDKWMHLGDCLVEKGDPHAYT